MSMIISGCGTGQLFEPTVRPTASFTLSGPETPTPTETPTPSETPPPTDTLAPTEAIPNFYPGLAPTLEQFTLVDKADIPGIIVYLRSQPSLVSPDASAVEVPQRLSSPNGSGHFVVGCSEGSCVVAASIQIQDRGCQPHIVIWEVKTQNGGSGYLLGMISYPPEWNNTSYNTVADESGKAGILIFTTGVGKPYQDKYPYVTYLVQQPGFWNAIDTWHTTGIIPPELETMIILETW